LLPELFQGAVRSGSLAFMVMGFLGFLAGTPEASIAK